MQCSLTMMIKSLNLQLLEGVTKGRNHLLQKEGKRLLQKKLLLRHIVEQNELLWKELMPRLGRELLLRHGRTSKKMKMMWLHFSIWILDLTVHHDLGAIPPVPQGSKISLVGSPSNLLKDASATNIVDDLSSILGGNFYFISFLGIYDNILILVTPFTFVSLVKWST